MEAKEEIKQKAEAKIEEERAQFAEKSVILAPLAWDDVSCSRFLEKKPNPPDYLFKNLLIKGIVGGFFATGGTGKSFLLLTMATCLATGEEYGIFRPSGKFKVLYVAGEDPEGELHRRMFAIADKMGLLKSKDLSNNLAVYSAAGKIGPLIVLGDNGNPTTSESYFWLQRSIENMGGLDVLILDPMSRFYGLNENDNTHATAWIACLEKLSQDYNLSILFAHHEAKATTTNQKSQLKDSTGRGASALRDGCRWAASLRGMTENAAKSFEVSNPRDYVEFDISKSNYSQALPNSIYFKRELDGTLSPVQLTQNKLARLADILINEISDLSNGDHVSRADLQLKKEGAGKKIANNLKFLKGFSHKNDMGRVIDYALQTSKLSEIEVPKSEGKSGPPKRILKVESFSNQN